MQNILVVGSSGHAKVVIDIIEKQGIFNIAGLIDRFRPIGHTTQDYEVLGTELDMPTLATKLEITGLILAIGDNYSRAVVSREIAAHCPNLPFVTAIHPDASIGRDVVIGDGTAVMAGVVINSACVVGRFCILNTKSSLDHDSLMEDYASLAPGVTTGGNCRIGTGSAVGIGATLRHGISIGRHTVIGGGSVVMKSIPDSVVSYGVPARIIRARNEGDKYL